MRHYNVAYAGFGSFVLCWFFIVSHNLDGLRPSQLSEKTKGDWGRWQIETSATWGNAFWSFMSGGLNYQIEHHLVRRCRLNNVSSTPCVGKRLVFNWFESKVLFKAIGLG